MIRRHLTPALVVSVLALVVALGGVGYAASVLPKNSVGVKQLKRDAVVSKKVKDYSLLAKDFRKGQLPAGPRGATGAPGQRGPSNAYRYDKDSSGLVLAASFTPVVTTGVLPAGSYVLMSRANIASTAGSSVICSIENDAAQNATVAGSGVLPLAQTATVTLTAPAAVSLNCLRSSGDATVYQASVTAIRVATLTSG